LATRWEIVADLDILQNAGVDLSGLFVVRRDADPDQRPLVGRIATLSAGRVELSESTDGSTSVDATTVMVEGRRDAFARCLKHLLGGTYARYADYRDAKLAQLLSGPPLLEEVTRVGQVLGERPLDLAWNLAGSVGTPLTIDNTPDYRSVVVARQLDYCF